MKASDKKEASIEVLGGVTKSLLSRIPVIKEVIDGAEAYKQYVFRNNVQSLMKRLCEKIEDMEKFRRVIHDSFQTPEGNQFIRKVIDAALDEQLQDKQEFVINAMINGVNDQTITQLEKLKFIDILRQLSRVAILVLLEIHKIQNLPVTQSTIINQENIVERLSHEYDPYLILSAINELVSAGLFSKIIDWRRMPNGHYKSGSYTPSAVNYTNFTTRFIKFISEPLKKINN